MLGSLQYLFPGWFAVVMGLCGLALAWHRAVPMMGNAAEFVSIGFGLLAAVVFAVLSAATVARAFRHAKAWEEDRQHPVRHTFIAALPIAMVLLATVAVANGLNGVLTELLWWTGSLAQLYVTVWVMSRWWKGNQAGGLQWSAVTPALFIPVVGNVLMPLAGMPLGHGDWALAQFGIGLLFWPLVLVLLMVRLALQGIWPERLLPASFILIAPPAVIGLASLQIGAPSQIAWMLWGIAGFTLLWLMPIAKRVAGMPFGLTHWGMSFPLAALAALTLRLAPSGPVSFLGLALLALTTLLIAALLLATFQGLRRGTLLVPEQAASIAITPQS